MTFSEALDKARHVVCGDMDGTFTCHTVDPYVTELVKAHDEEVAALSAKLRRARELLSHVDTSKVKTTWVSVGQNVFDGEDSGSIVAECYDRDSKAGLIAWSVNTIMDLKELLEVK